MQRWKATAFAPDGVHDWHQFIKLTELDHMMRIVDLHRAEARGLAPTNPLAAINAMRARARGRITTREMADRITFRLTDRTPASYIGYAHKR